MEAAKLLREFENQAWNSLTSTLVSKGNFFHFSGFTIADNRMSQLASSMLQDHSKGHWFIKLHLNDAEFQLKGQFDQGLRPEMVAKSIFDSVLKTIQEELVKYLTPIISEALTPIRR